MCVRVTSCARVPHRPVITFGKLFVDVEQEFDALAGICRTAKK